MSNSILFNNYDSEDKESTKLKIMNKKLKRDDKPKNGKYIKKTKSKMNIRDSKKNFGYQNDNKFKLNPNQLFIELTKDSYSCIFSDNTFIVFKSIGEVIYLVYTNRCKSIICFSITDNCKMNEIRGAHNGDITNFRHFLDKINKRDLILSLSEKENNVKIWNIINFQLLLNLKNINKEGGILSSCLLTDENQNYLVTSNFNNFGISEAIKVYDFEGNKIKDIKDSKNNTFFIDCYFDQKLSKNFIITGNKSYVKSYDYSNNNVYHLYCEHEYASHFSVDISHNYEGVIKLVESNTDGIIRVWDFHTAKLLKKIKIRENKLYGICLLKDHFLFVGCQDKTIKLIELNSGKIIKELKGHNKTVITIKRINHPEYGECLLSQGRLDGKIRLWIFKNIIK